MSTTISGKMGLLRKFNKLLPRFILWWIFLTVLLLFSIHFLRPPRESRQINNHVERGLEVEEEFTEDEIASGKLRIDHNNDLKIVSYVKTHHLIPPPKDRFSPADITPRKISNGFHKTVSRYVSDYFQNKTKGFFVQCGAVDGEYKSKTLPLEMDLDWTGLLIEPDPNVFEVLKKRNRNVWISDACISPFPFPVKMNMVRNKRLEGQGFVLGFGKFAHKNSINEYKHFKAQCFPMHTVLKAVNRTIVDYLSLDIEGTEYSALKNIPWDKIFIKMISIQVYSNFDVFIKSYMTRPTVGYKLMKIFEDQGIKEMIYVHPAFVIELV